MSQSDRFGSGFVLGAVLGGVLGGILGASLAQRPTSVARQTRRNGQVRSRFSKTDGSVEAQLEHARQSVEDKIALINQAIESLRQEMDTVEEQQTSSSLFPEDQT
jgi:hypothetical protein